MTSTATTNPTEKMNLRAALIEGIGGYMAAASIGVAADLGLADLIKDGVRGSDELAAESGTHEPSLRRLLRVLVAVGITSEPEPGRFALTDVGSQLRSDSPDSLLSFTRMFCHPALVTSWQELRHSVTTGERAFDKLHGTDFYSHLANNEAVSALFNVAMGEESRIAAAQVAAGYDFSSAKKVVDLGGGDGTLLAAILPTQPHLQGIVFDSASGVAEAPGVLEKAGITDRCEARAGDFFQDIPTDGDLYIIKSVFQDWNDEDARALLRSCRAQIPASATLLIVGSVLPETASTDQPIAFFTDLNMLVNSGGRERTESEFRAMLEDTGFTVQSVQLGAAGPLSIIQAVPASA
ncbi:acetylserotonin O-methyltransferase [Streptomyces sp. A3M-1-3]|uniref:acetylserotonin O-methyltransferase n=1 Tax=Streptomyces sp. A3M-1-3 TaxID=2962044 RepID=UPI0020B711E0|nr:acetylserotonin O-methyltransferase [Streptomyces sp. A3M-1-3]MCP3817855.1 acetylserotonin O-methyltransferase [Streptomyces sp. A3M-1-3]